MVAVAAASTDSFVVVVGQGHARMLIEPGSRRWLEAVVLNMVSGMVFLGRAILKPRHVLVVGIR